MWIVNKVLKNVRLIEMAQGVVLCYLLEQHHRPERRTPQCHHRHQSTIASLADLAGGVWGCGEAGRVRIPGRSQVPVGPNRHGWAREENVRGFGEWDWEGLNQALEKTMDLWSPPWNWKSTESERGKEKRGIWIWWNWELGGNWNSSGWRRSQKIINKNYFGGWVSDNRQEHIYIGVRILSKATLLSSSHPFVVCFSFFFFFF